MEGTFHLTGEDAMEPVAFTPPELAKPRDVHWTASDIYALVDVLPKEIERSLKGTVDSLQTQTIEVVSNAAKQTCAAHEQAARSLAASAWADQDELQVAAR